MWQDQAHHWWRALSAVCTMAASVWACVVYVGGGGGGGKGCILTSPSRGGGTIWGGRQQCGTVRDLWPVAQLPCTSASCCQASYHTTPTTTGSLPGPSLPPGPPPRQQRQGEATRAPTRAAQPGAPGAPRSRPCRCRWGRAVMCSAGAFSWGAPGGVRAGLGLAAPAGVPPASLHPQCANAVPCVPHALNGIMVLPLPAITCHAMHRATPRAMPCGLPRTP